MTLRFGCLDPDTFRRSWRWGVLASTFCMIYTSICIDTPRTKFLSTIGFTAFHFGIVAGLASLSWGFQIVAGIITRYLRWRKPFWFITVLIQRLLFTAVLAAPFIFRGNSTLCIWTIIIILFLHDSFGNISGPPWQSWMSDIMPRDRINILWGQRLKWITFAQILGTIAAAFVMSHFETQGRIVTGYLYLGLVGVVFGVADVILFNHMVPENYHNPKREGRIFDAIMEPLRDKKYRPFITFMVWWYFSMMVAGPFFTVYLVRGMNMPIFWVQMTAVSALLGIVIGAPIMGILCDTYGSRPVLHISILLKTVALLPYVMIPNDPALYWVFPLTCWGDGVLNAGIAIGIQNGLFSITPRKSRTMYIAVTQFIAIGIAGGIPPLLSGLYIDAHETTGVSLGFGYTLNVYFFIFWVSLILRLFAIPLTKPLPSYNNMGTLKIMLQLMNRSSVQVFVAIAKLSLARTPAQRARACEKLGKLGNPMGVSTLLQMLSDDSLGVRRTAVRALGQIGDDKATAALAHAMLDPASDLRSPAAAALGAIGGPESLRYLLKNLSLDDRDSILSTIDALREIGDTAAILPLVCMLNKTDDIILRHAIAHTLRELGHSETDDGGIVGLMARNNARAHNK